MLAYLVAYNLMRSRQKVRQGADRFWQELISMEKSYAERDELRVHGMRTDTAGHLVAPLFEPVLPTVGNEGYIDAPRTLLTSAFDAAARVGDSIHMKKDELLVDNVMARLEREIKALSKH